MKLTSVAGGLVAATLISLAGPSYAALVSCPADFTANGTAKVHDGGGAPILTAASMCQYISPPDNSNVANETNVNAAGFFGTTDWEILASANQVDVNAGSGTWTIASPQFATQDYMIVFKDGQGTNLVGFLFNELFSSGGWDTPFANPPFTGLNGNQEKEVSHYSIFSRTPFPPGQVPEPGSVLLLGLGLAGLALMRRRRA